MSIKRIAVRTQAARKIASEARRVRFRSGVWRSRRVGRYGSKTRRVRSRWGRLRSGRRRRILYHVRHATKMSIKRMSVRTPAASTIPCQPCDEDVDQKDVGQDAGGDYYTMSATRRRCRSKGCRSGRRRWLQKRVAMDCQTTDFCFCGCRARRQEPMSHRLPVRGDAQAWHETRMRV